MLMCRRYKMADKELQDRIIKFLNSKAKKKESSAKIIQTLRVPKKSLNNQLYRLQHEGRVVKCQDSPPVWALPGSGTVTSVPLIKRRSKRVSRDITLSRKRDDVDLKCKILEYLEGKSKQSKSLDIAKGTGHSRANDVNPTLYKMLQEGLIRKVAEKPPAWALATEMTQLNSEGAEGIAMDSSVENDPSDNRFYKGQGIPEFQDRELFKTEPLFETQTLPAITCLKEENKAGCSNIEYKQSEGFAPAEEDMDVSSQGSYGLSENYGNNLNNSFQRTDNHGKLEDDSYECDENTLDESEKDSEQRMDVMNFDRKLLHIKEENLGGMINFAGNSGTGNDDEYIFAKKHAWSHVRNQQDESPDLNPEYVNVKKPKTFRDVFNLDDPMSDDSSDSFESAKGIETEIPLEDEVTSSEAVKSLISCKSDSNLFSENAENQCTPELHVISSEMDTPEQRNDQHSLSTPQILDSALNMSDTSAQELDRKTNDFAVLQGMETMVNTEHDLEAKDEISQVEMGKDISGDYVADEVQPDTKSDEFNMEDCDKVLKVLNEFKAIAQFVLKRKTDIPPEHLDEVLQKCLSLKFVSGSSKLWKITDEGISYISKISGRSDIQKECEQNIQTERLVKPTFKGPPPSPRALLNKEGAGIILKSGPLNRQTLKPTCKAFTSHSPNSLFKPPSVSNSNSSSRTDICKSGPQSLMSIQFDSNPLDRSDKGKLSSQESLGKEIPQPLMSIQFDSNSINRAKIISSQRQEGNRSSYMETNDLNLEYGSNLRRAATESSAYNTTSHNMNSKAVALSQSVSMDQLFTRSGQASLTQKTSNNQLNASQTTFRTTQITPEHKKTDIPEKYSDYPNQSTSLQCLKSKTRSKSSDRSGSSSLSKSAFGKGPPPSPLDIISKGLKKTEISPPSSYKDKMSVSHSSGSFPTMSISLSNRNLGTSTQHTKNKPVFSSGQFGSQSHSGSSIETSVNQSSIMQTGSLFGIENRQSVLQKSEQMTIQSSPQSFGAKPSSKGPPPPPAVKLGLQSAQSIPTPVQKQTQNAPKPNLGLVLNTESFNALNKNPVSALMEYAQSRKMVATVEVLSRKGSSHKPIFEMAAFVGKRKFPSVTCHNKKDGRKEACDIAMRQLVAEGQFQAESASNTSSIPPVPCANLTHFDTVAALTHRGFTALVSQITAESFAGRKVIAGLVMKRSTDDVGVLVSLGTGNRCITGQQMSLQGNTVNDSHAEIITRRGFMRFLYKRLMEYDPNQPHPMLEKSPRGKLQIRPNISFHLYISTAPCGDGALFSPRDAESAKAPLDTRIRPPHEPTFSSNVQGLLRTKVEGGEGTIPVEPGFKAQTFDGIQRGERLRTMSCTDKICRWNVVGMQGALLSHFLEPIYLDSLTLGLLYDHGHLCRAVCCRVGRGAGDVNNELPSGFKLNHPWLGRVTVCDPPREVQKTKALSINWCFGDNGPEVTDGTQGLCYTSIEKGFFSRCSKRNLFTSFKSLCEKFGRKDLLAVSSYNEAKMAAQDFVLAKVTMLRRFKENGFGKWVSKPVEEEMFGYEEKN